MLHMSEKEKKKNPVLSIDTVDVIETETGKTNCHKIGSIFFPHFFLSVLALFFSLN
jgi:hypothetical protein